MKHVVDIPPAWFLGCACTSWVLASWIPVYALDLPKWLGWTVVALGFLWAASAVALFLREGTPVEPRNTPRVLLRAYHFRVNRNPIYTGMTVVLLGWAMLLGAATAFLPALAFPFIITRRFILDEERELRASFGRAAEDYFRRTRRW